MEQKEQKEAAGVKDTAKQPSDKDLSAALDHALYYLSRGFSIIPVISGTKRPALPSWKEFQERQATDEEVRRWFGKEGRNGIGIVTGAISGIAVVDFDSPEAIEFARLHDFPSTPLVKTGKGYHAYYRYSPGIRNFQMCPRPQRIFSPLSGHAGHPPS